MTLKKMSRAMKSEQIGSAISQPNWRMRMVEMMTPTLPKVSARTWRKTPVEQNRVTVSGRPQRRPRAPTGISTPHVGIHSHTPTGVGVAVSAVHVAAVGVAVAPVAVLAVGVAVVRMTVVVRRAAFPAVGVGVAKSTYPHQVDQ